MKKLLVLNSGVTDSKPGQVRFQDAQEHELAWTEKYQYNCDDSFSRQHKTYNSLEK